MRSCGDSASDTFVVEGPQIFACTTAAPNDHDVRPSPLTDPLDCGADLFGGSVALHFRRAHDDLHTGRTAAYHSYYIPNSRAVRARDDRHALRREGEPALPPRSQETVALQTHPRLLQRFAPQVRRRAPPCG